jgi:hypothetical protein
VFTSWQPGEERGGREREVHSQSPTSSQVPLRTASGSRTSQNSTTGWGPGFQNEPVGTFHTQTLTLPHVHKAHR